MKRRLMQGTVAAAITIAAFSLTGAAGAQPDAPDHTFGPHVADCALATAFDGAHNPGIHQGAAGWDGSACPG